ncbi:flagellin, partial [Romboutsia sp.]|uniref:flagellin n=1 Tax=Romboutsia sp. TaxID=1965302 RepID=UPI003F2D7F9D
VNNKNEDGTINTELDKKLSETLKVDLSDGIRMDYNLTIDDITKTAGDKSGNKSGLEILNNIVKELEQDPVVMENIKNLSTDLDGYMNDILNNRSLVGSKTNTVEAVKESNEANILEMTATFSSIQDVDYAEKFMELKSAEMIYNASLQVGAKLIKPTILDYLR